jgi:uroporphyrin-3 C-methyltransferase
VNTDISEIDAEPTDSAATRDVYPSEKPRGGGSGLAFLALLVALAALLAAAWLWWQDKSSGAAAESLTRSDIVRLDASVSGLSAQLQELREELESQPDGADDARFEALQTAITEDRQQAAALQQAMQERATLARSTQSAIEALHGRLVAAESALAGLDARELDARGELDLAEVDYLLRLANERLLLFSDPRSADRALALADGHLAALDNPAYLGVRQSIAAARGDLAAVELPDDLAIAGQLEAIQQAIPGLPFPPASPSVAEGEAPAEAGWWEKLKAALANLVTVRRSTEQESRRLSLQDKDYIRQRLWMQVEVSYLALMRHDQDAFRNGLQRVQASLAEWFDPASSEVAAVAQTLDALLAVDIAVSWPDISEPWNTLRLVRAAQSIAKPANPAQPPATPMPGQPPAEADVPEPPADGESGGGKP